MVVFAGAAVPSTSVAVASFVVADVNRVASDSVARGTAAGRRSVHGGPHFFRYMTERTNISVFQETVSSSSLSSVEFTFQFSSSSHFNI